MAGHSKWANIKHKKQKTDAKRGKIFTKIGRELVVAVRQGGTDPENNTKLKDTISKAKSLNMPGDNIQRAIKKAAGDLDGATYEEIVYEGYGPGGVAVIVEAMTDNRNRTAADVRHYFDKFGGNLGTIGCVSYMFNKQGVILIEKSEESDEEEVMLEAIDAGAQDFQSEEEFFEVTTLPSDFSSVREVLEKSGHSFFTAEISMIPSMYTKLTEDKETTLMEKLIDHIEDLDDVQNIYHNWEQEDQ